MHLTATPNGFTRGTLCGKTGDDAVPHGRLDESDCPECIIAYAKVHAEALVESIFILLRMFFDRFEDPSP